MPAETKTRSGKKIQYEEPDSDFSQEDDDQDEQPPPKTTRLGGKANARKAATNKRAAGAHDHHQAQGYAASNGDQYPPPLAAPALVSPTQEMVAQGGGAGMGAAAAVAAGGALHDTVAPAVDIHALPRAPAAISSPGVLNTTLFAHPDGKPMIFLMNPNKNRDYFREVIQVRASSWNIWLLRRLISTVHFP